MLPTRSSLPIALLGLAWLSAAAPALRAQESELKEHLTRLNRATGSGVVAGEYKTLLADKSRAKKLLAYAARQAKGDPADLTYNGALILAEVAKDLDDTAAAEQMYRVCTRQAAALESSVKLLQSYGALIELLYDNKLYDKSAKVCRELLELKPASDQPRITMIAVSSRFGEPTFIPTETYNAASPLKEGVHQLLIQALAKEGKFDQALKLTDNLIQAEDHWSQRQLKAWVLREAGKSAEAAKAYEDVIDQVIRDKDLKPEQKKKTEDRYRYILSNVYVDLNQIDKASEQLKSLMNRNPKDPGFCNDLGYIWADHGMNLEEAEKLIRQALELDREKRKADPAFNPDEDRDNGAYLDSLGWVLFKQMKYKEAKEWLLKAVEDEDAQHIEIYDHLGDAHFALGEREAALKAWRRGLEFATQTARDQRRRAQVEEKIKKYSQDAN